MVFDAIRVAAFEDCAKNRRGIYSQIAIVELCKYLQHSCKAVCLIVADTLPYSPVRRAGTTQRRIYRAPNVGGTMSFTFAQSGGIALNQFESSPGTPIVTSELFFRRFRETRIHLLSTLPFAVPIQAQVPRLALRVPSEIWQHGVSIHTVDKRDN